MPDLSPIDLAPGLLGWLFGTPAAASPDDMAALQQQATDQLAAKMRRQSQSVQAPENSDSGALSFNDRWNGWLGSPSPANPTVPLPQPRPNFPQPPAPDNALDTMMLNNAVQNNGLQSTAPAMPLTPTIPPGGITTPSPDQSIGDRAMAAFTNFVAGAHGGGLLGGLAGLVQGAATGERADPIGMQNQTVQALVNKGNLSPEIATMIARNPDVLKAVLPQVLGMKSLEHVTLKDSLGNEIPVSFAPTKGQYFDTSGKPLGGNAGLPGISPSAAMPVELDPNTGRDEKFLASLNPIDRQATLGVLNGDMNAAGRNLQKYLPYAARAEPGFSQQAYFSRLATMKDFAPQGVSGKNITAINTGLGHVDRLNQAIDTLGNFSIAPSILNPTYNAIRGQISPDYQRNVAAFRQDVNAVSGELAKAFRSAGMSEADIQNWRKSFDEDSSPATMRSASQEALHLLDSRLNAITNSYNRGMGLSSTKQAPDLLSPEARRIHDRLIGSAPAENASTQTAPQAADPLTQARAAIAKGAPRNQVILRLQRMGIGAAGL